MKNCPCCNDILLRYIYQGKITWFCRTCRQQMPNLDSLLQQKRIAEATKITSKISTGSPQLLTSKNSNFQQKTVGSSELDSLKFFIARSEFRLHMVNLIVSNRSRLVTNAMAKEVDRQKSSNEIKGHPKQIFWLGDGKLILSYVAYAFLIGDASVLNNSNLNNLKQAYTAIDTPLANLSCLIESLKLKTVALISQAASEHLNYITKSYCFALISELSNYFDAVATVIG